MTQVRYDNISLLTNSPYFQPQYLSGISAEVIRSFSGLAALLSILPVRAGNVPLTFKDEVRQNILTIAPKVSEAQDTPLDTMSFVDNVFTGYESRMGYVLSSRNMDKAPIDLSARASRRIGKAVANRCLYECFRTFRAFDSMYSGSRFSAGPTTKWNQAGSDPLGDIEVVRNYISNLTGEGVTFLIMNQSVNSALSIHPDITDKNRNLNVEFGPDGRLTKLKGMTIITIPEVTFIDPFGNSLPLYPSVTTLDAVVWTNYVIFGVGGDGLGYTGVVTSNGGSDRMAPAIVTKPDEYNRRFGIMGYLELVHVIQDWFVLAVLNAVI
jgi:hypothetical protein